MDTIQRIVQVATVLAVALLGSQGVKAQEPDWSVIKPSNSGIPGEEMRFMRWAPDGNLWVAARWPFWHEGGIGVYDFDTQVWSGWSNWETPIPSEYIYDLEFDQDGVAWIATRFGLVRFDGETWTVYDSTNSPMLLDQVLNISIAPNGHVWINNSDFDYGGDAIYDFDRVSTWVSYSVADDLPWEAPWSDLAYVFVDDGGHVWVTNDALSGVAEFDGSTWTLHGESVDRFDKIVEDLEGHIWLKSNDGWDAFYKYDHVTFTSYPISTTPTTLAVDDDGSVLTGDWLGNVRKTTDGGQTWTFFLTGLNRVVDIAPDPASTDVWIGTPGAVGHFTGDASWVRDYNTYNTGMPWYWVDYMSVDRDGYFWLATDEAGLSRFDGQQWRNWGDHNAGSEPYPFAGNDPMGGAYQDVDGVHWFGGNGIARWDSETGQFTGFWNWENNPGMGVTLFPFFAEDMNGRLFASDEHGVTFHYDLEEELWVREPISPYAVLGLPGMQADSQGNVWIAAWFDIYEWDGSAWSTVNLPYPDYFYDLGGMSALAIDGNDDLWLGTIEGLVHYDGQTFTLYDQSNTPMPASSVRGIDFRSDGVIGLSLSEYVGTVPYPHGACIVDGPIGDPASWSIYSYQEGYLPHYQLGRCSWDADGNFWVSTLGEGSFVLHLGPPAVPGDMDGDGDVDLDDHASFVECLAGPEVAPSPGEPLTAEECLTVFDFDEGGDVDLRDYSVFIESFGVGSS